RQGRKYRVYGWIASQRLAHMNVNALQQLHSYFVSTLPRYYDRMVVADAFSLSYELLDKVTELDTGEWLFVSFKATKQRNVPSFIKAYNNEDILIENLKKLNFIN
ncbi:MAG: ATPase, partial [Candidatus Bathyarchaeota archaeon]|nr:ATPase [Candidatus Bathyarchaeota archaeon]